MKIYLLFISLLVVMHSSGQTDSADFYNNFIGFVSNDVDVTSDFFDGPSGNIVASIEKPFDGWVHYVIILQEDSMFGGIASDIAAMIMENCFEKLDAPVKRVASLDTPIPFAANLESNYLPKNTFKTDLLDLIAY